MVLDLAKSFLRMFVEVILEVMGDSQFIVLLFGADRVLEDTYFQA